MKAEDALDLWQKEGALTPKKANELRLVLEKNAEDHVGKGIVIFSTIGAVLVGLGILLFIGSNWEDMAPIIRLAVLFAVYGVICAGAFVAEQRDYPKVAESLWFLSTISFGANIFLIAQIYHFSLTFWQGPLLWLIGVLAMGHVRRKIVYAWLAVPLFVLAIGWYGTGPGWFIGSQMEFLGSDTGLRPVLPSLGLGLVSLAFLLRRFNIWNYAATSWIGWGVLMIAIPLVVMTAEAGVMEEFFRMDINLKQLLIISISFLLSAVAVGVNALKTVEGRVTLLTTAVLLFLFTLHSDGRPVIGTLVEQSLLGFLFYILFAFVLSLLTIWSGVRMMEKHLVNVGVASASFIILIQYFAWSFEMLHSSIAFILGGIVLIALSIFMEKTRRKLLSQMTKS